MQIYYVNDAYGELLYSINASQGTLTLKPGGGSRFPSPPAGTYGILLVYDPSSTAEERVKWTLTSGDVLTIERQYDGSVARGFGVNSRVECIVTAGGLNSMMPRTGDNFTGPVGFPDGTASVASLYRSGYVDTGLVFNPDGSVSITTGSSMRGTFSGQGLSVFGKITSTGALSQSYAGVSREIAAGSGVIRDIAGALTAATTGSIEYGVSYNANVNPTTGVWANRDINDICWMKKYNHGSGVEEFWYAPSSGSISAPVWTKSYAFDPAAGTVTVSRLIGTADALTNTRSISMTGDMSWTVNFSGSGNVTGIGTLANVVTPGTYKSVTVNAKGLVTAGSNPTTLTGYGITDAESVIDGAASTVAHVNLTVSRVLVSDGSGKIAASGITASVLGFLSSLSADIASLFNLKANVANATFTGATTLGQDPTLAMQASTKQYSDSQAHVPVGAVCFFPATAAGTGFLKMNGVAVPRAVYAALWTYAQSSGNLASTEGSKLAGQFGPGDGSTTFSLPDARGEFIRGWVDDRGGVPDSGRQIGSWQDGLVGVHTHPFTASITSYGPRGGAGGEYWGAAPISGNTGNNTGAETRPRNVAMLACIKY